MPGQAKELVRRLRLGVDGVDFHNDWKVITVFIGGNNLCAYCKKPASIYRNIMKNYQKEHGNYCVHARACVCANVCV